MRKISGIFLVLCVVLTCAPARAAEPIKIGVIAPLTGDLNESGNEIRLGATLAVQFFRQQYDPSAPVELLIEDSGGTPMMAVNAASKLLNEGVVGVVSGPSPGHNLHAARILEEDHIPLVSATYQDEGDAMLDPGNAVASELHRLYGRETQFHETPVPSLVLSAFDATLALLLSAKAVDYAPDPERIARQLHSSQFNVASGEISFSPAQPDKAGAKKASFTVPEVILFPNKCVNCDCKEERCTGCDKCK